MAGYELAVGKYAWNLGLCQWVTPGIMTRSISAMTSFHWSGLTGASSGISGFKYPGWTVGRTRLRKKGRRELFQGRRSRYIKRLRSNMESVEINTVFVKDIFAVPVFYVHRSREL